MSRFRQNRTPQERTKPNQRKTFFPNQGPRGIGPNRPQNKPNKEYNQFTDYRERPQKRHYESEKQPGVNFQHINYLMSQEQSNNGQCCYSYKQDAFDNNNYDNGFNDYQNDNQEED